MTYNVFGGMLNIAQLNSLIELCADAGVSK